MRTAVLKSRSKKSLNKALLTTLVIALGVSVSACSGGSDEVLAIDRVEQAADIARQNAPEAEDMKFPETAPVVMAAATPAADMPATDMPATDMAATAEVAPAEAASGTADLAVDVGAQLYAKQCTACHSVGLLGSPKFGDAAAWAPRIAKGKETLYLHAAKGFNQMNAQVNAEVTEDQVHAAVDYMVAAAS